MLILKILLAYLVVGLVFTAIVTRFVEVVKERKPELMGPEYWINRTPTVFYQRIVYSRFTPAQYVVWCTLMWFFEVVASTVFWGAVGVALLCRHLSNKLTARRFVWKLFYRKQLAGFIADKLTNR